VHPVCHGAPAAEQPPLSQQERADTHRADSPRCRRPSAQPPDQLPVAEHIVNAAGAGDDKSVNRAVVERRHGLGDDAHAIGRHE
jgi:hypothetical protein